MHMFAYFSLMCTGDNKIILPNPSDFLKIPSEHVAYIQKKKNHYKVFLLRSFELSQHMLKQSVVVYRKCSNHCVLV